MLPLMAFTTLLASAAVSATSRRAAAHSAFPDGATDSFTPEVTSAPGGRLLVSIGAFGRAFSLDLAAPGHDDHADDSEGDSETRRVAEETNVSPEMRSCVRRGLVDSRPDSLAVVSLCGVRGLRGLFAVGGEHFEVAPVEGAPRNGSVHGPHSITRTHASARPSPSDIPASAAAAAILQSATRAARSKRFVSRPRYVQVLAVADDTMVSAYGERLEEHLLTVLGAADALLRRASLGSPVRLTVAGIVVASGDKAGARTTLEVSSNAALALREFCKWQLQLNRRGQHHPERHDTAVLFTRKDLCGSQGCQTLGMADVGTVCDPARSCAVIEDDGLQSAFTVTHELGHVLGMPHDDATACTEKFGPARARHLMASELSGLDFGSLWSECSAASLVNFLDDGHGDCLLNKPRSGPRLPAAVPGSVYGADRQCQLAFGPRSAACPGMDVCQRLWCTEERGRRVVCLTKNLPAAEGTPCGRASQCLEGVCVDSDKVKALKKVDGEWGAWGAWSECSRSCGGGVQLSSRGCDAPEPQHGGAYCVGQRVQYRSCNTQSCGHSEMRYREEQCAAHDGRHAGLPGLGDAPVQWAPKYAGLATKDQCKLVCRARSSAFYAVLAQRVRDGTPCSPGVQGVCVSGRCLRTGCDRVIGSRRRFDRCGRCGGDGSACRRVSGSFTPKRFGYSDAVTVPAGATSLKVWRKSEREARAYLALRDARGEPLLNGAYTVAPGRTLVPLGGVTLAYSGWAPRGETLRLLEPGAALPEPLAVQVLLTSAGASVRVRYEYHVPADGRPAREGRGDGGNDDERSNEIEAAPPPPPPAAMTAGGDEDAARAARAKTLKQQGATLVRHAKGRSDAAPGEGGGGGGSNRLAATGDAAGGEPGAERWAAGPWRSCTRQCGGWQRRDVRCVGAGGVGAAHGLCPLGGRPAAFRACLAQSCPPV